MIFKLACGKDPARLKISKDDTWDMTAFARHVARCKDCQAMAIDFQHKLAEALGQIILEVRHCQRCGHNWRPRKNISRVCPRCKSPWWQERRN